MKTLTDNNGKQFKLGRNRPCQPHMCTSFKELIKANVLPNVIVPATTHYSAAAAPSIHNIYLNDQLGDCCCSGAAHIRGITSFNSGGPGVIFTNEQIIEQYSAIGGYNPNAPLQPDGTNPTDQGCDENTALNYWKTTGFPDGIKLIGSMAVDATNIEEVRLAMYLFENLYFGMELPDAWINPSFPNPGFRWDVAGAPDPNNGHCVIGCDLVPNGVKIATWGFTGYMTHAAISYYAAPAQGGQLFTMLSPDIVNKVTKKSPAGYDSTALSNYLGQL